MLFAYEMQEGGKFFKIVGETDVKSSLSLIKAQWVTFLKNVLVFFWANFICIAKRNNFVEEFFSIRTLFRRENSI
jgi:hypothetical protein